MHVTPLEDLRRSETAALFEGAAAGGVAVSMFVTDYPPGRGPDLHLHPYAEVFYVQTGTGEFTAGDEQRLVEAGHIVVVPPDTPHGFKCRSDRLQVVSVHPSPQVIQTDL
ncbi:MAG: cupin domain-containing protein [Solirubrobacteraceae bacterium]